MNDDEIRSFLDRPLVATVASASSRGEPHAVPVWYRFDGSSFAIWTDESRRWAKNVRRRPEVSLVVAEHVAPYSAVLARGTAEVLTDAPGTDDEIRLITARYVDASGVDDYIAQWSGLRTIVRVTPEVMRAWGRGY